MRTAAILALGGLALLVASFDVDRPAPVALRLLGVAVLALGGVAWGREDARDLLRDGVGALRGDRVHLLALVAIVAAGGLFRVSLIGLDLGYDEAYTYLKHAVQPLGLATAQYELPNNHMLNTVLMRLSTHAFGLSTASIRLPAFVAGVATVPAVYAAGRLLHTREVGLVAAGLAAVSAPLIAYSVNGRGYSMSWLAFAILLALSARLVDGGGAATWSLWVLTAVLGLYAVPTTALAVATVACWSAATWLTERRWRRIAELAAALAVTGGLVAVLYWDVRDEPGWSYATDPIRHPAAFAVDTFAAMHQRTGIVLTVVFGVLALAGLLLHTRTARSRVPVAAVAVLLVPVFAVVLPRVPPFERSWLYLVVPEVIAVGAGVVGAAGSSPAAIRARLRLLPPVVVAAVIGLGALVTVGRPPYVEDAPVRGAAQTLRALRVAAPQTPVVVSPFTYASFLVAAQMERFNAGLLLTSRPGPGQPALLAVSPTNEETPASVMALDSFGPDAPRARLVRRYGEMEIYRLAR